MTVAATQELEAIATHLLTQMREGADRWYMPWHKGLEEPYNRITGRVFKGRNAAILWSQATQRGYLRNQWATLKQWAGSRAKVRRGAKGVRVFAPVHRNAPDLFKLNSSDLAGFRGYHVFNVQELNNYNPDHPDMFDGEMVGCSVGDFAQKTGARIQFFGDRACYRSHEDIINMPPRNRFIPTPHTTADEGFQSTLIHELVHWTKPENRANRVAKIENPEQAYAFEELVAELGAALICTRFSQRIEPRHDHAAYLKSWLSALENDFSYFYKALYLAQSAAHWLYVKTDTVPAGWVLASEEQASAASEANQYTESCTSASTH